MHFKIKSWDIFSSSNILFSDTGTLQASLVKDPYFQFMICEKLKHDQSDLKVISAHAISENWFHENYQEIGLFVDNTTYVITNAEALDNETHKTMLDFDWESGTKKLKLIYGKSHKSFTSLQKTSSPTVEVIEPKSWEFYRLVPIFEKYFQVKLEVEAKEYLLNYCRVAVDEYFNTFMYLKTLGLGRSVLVSDLEQEFMQSKFDIFKLAEKLNQKNTSALYQQIIEADVDQSTMIGALRFLEGHILKIMGPGEIRQKPRPSKYDRGILEAAKNWKHQELLDSLEFFGDLSEQVKKDDQWKNIVKLKLIEERKVQTC